MNAHDLVFLAVLALQTLFQLWMQVDRWRVQQETGSADVKKDLESLRKMILDANERASTQESRIQAKLLELDHDVIRLKAIEESRRRYDRD